MAYVVSAAATQRKFNSIYALPTSGDATKLVATNMNPLIRESLEVKRLLDFDTDNNELKKIGANFIFIRGTKSETAALSISADALVVDELDRCDPDVVKQFRSRLEASDHKIIKQFSTPTIEGVGISKEALTSKRYRHMATCHACGHAWLPSYHTDIVIPAFKGDLTELTAENLKDVDYQNAKWVCPSCGADPKLHPSRLEWVCENPSENYEAHTYFISPVTACLVLPPSYLVRTSTEFNTRSEWKNQVLGETSEEANEQISREDVARASVDADLRSSEMHYLGADIGQMCAVSIGRLAQDGTLLVVHRENVPLPGFMQRRAELMREYRCVNSVHDTQPETHLITQICDFDPNAYGASFATGKSPELFTLQEKEENAEEGKLNLRLVKIHRTLGLDTVKDLFKSGKVLMRANPKFDSHYVAMKRTQKFIKDELTYVWEKTDGEDHMLFSLLYLMIAIKLRGRVTGWTAPGAVSMVSAYRLKAGV